MFERPRRRARSCDGYGRTRPNSSRRSDHLTGRVAHAAATRISRWLWDGSFCGSIGFRWQPGTPDLPMHVLGRIDYAVVAWKRGRGYAPRALALLLPALRATGLPFVELITDPENAAS